MAMYGYLTIIPRGRVGYEMIDSQRGGRVGYNHLLLKTKSLDNAILAF